MDASVAGQLIVTVRSALAHAIAVADTTSDPNLRAQIQGATKMLQRAIDDWAGEQLNEVNAGTRDEKRWTDYGNELMNDALWFEKENSSFFVQYSNLLNQAGNAAQDVESAIGSALADGRTKYNTLKLQLAGADTRMAALMELAAALKPVEHKLSDELHDLLFGATAQDAQSNLASGHSILDHVGSLLDAADAGAKFIFRNNDIVPSSTGATDAPVNTETEAPDYLTDQGGSLEDTSASAQGLGVTWLVGTIAILGILAGIVAVNAICLTIVRYLAHTEEVANEAQANKILNDPSLTEAQKADLLAKLEGIARARADNPPPGASGAGWSTKEYVVAGVAGTGAFLIILSIFTDAFSSSIKQLRGAFKGGR